MKILKSYWCWLKSHPLFAVVTALLMLVFAFPILIPMLKKTNLPGTAAIPDVTPTADSPVKGS